MLYSCIYLTESKYSSNAYCGELAIALFKLSELNTMFSRKFDIFAWKCSRTSDLIKTEFTLVCA